MPKELIEIDDKLRTEIYKYYETVNPDNFAQNLAAAKEAKRQFDEMRRAVESAPDARNGTAWRDDLLTVPVQLSPRLAWMKARGVHIIHNKGIEPGTECELSGETLYPYCAHRANDGAQIFVGNMAGYGNTEDEAIVALALANGWKLWNEQ